MRVPIYTAVLPILGGLAFAQDTPPAQPKQPAASSAAASPSSAPQEMKTQMYSGTLMDASCANSGSAATAPAGATASADRAAGSDKSQACTLSASTSQFALKMKDGNTVRLDDVGNMRVQEAMKTRKKWGDSAAASKPIQVKISGVMSGDKLTVLSVN
uniref:DUF5666 domain-containing protein n=1 Tax=Solibacter usitatus (strain Ellin6076) TaxID=234267 RepID=Q01W28_SOLUE